MCDRRGIAPFCAISAPPVRLIRGAAELSICILVSTSFVSRGLCIPYCCFWWIVVVLSQSIKGQAAKVRQHQDGPNHYQPIARFGNDYSNIITGGFVMASIRKRTNNDGSISYRVDVRLKGFPPQRATFSRLTDARQWGKSTE